MRCSYEGSDCDVDEPKFTIASRRLYTDISQLTDTVVSPGAATDGVTLFFLEKY